MEQHHRQRATVVDVLDRVLDRGLIIDADIVISLAGVPLIGLNLRAALGGIEAWNRYGAAGVERGTPTRTEGLPAPRPGGGSVSYRASRRTALAAGSRERNQGSGGSPRED